VAAGLATRLSASGKRTLLAELGDESFYQDYLGLNSVTYQPTNYQKQFDVCLWSGAAALREYALYLLKVESLYKLFFENAVSRTLINVAPALAELAILGKITSGPPRNVGPKLPYDALVVDAYSTGHFVALLNAPIGMGEAVRFGPMGEQSRGIIEVMKDPQICHYHLVCLPEELPVQESLELDQTLRGIVGIAPYLWLNKWIDYPEDLNAKGPVYEKDFYRKRERQKWALQELGPVFRGRLSQIPFFFETDEKILIQNLAREMPP